MPDFSTRTRRKTKKRSSVQAFPEPELATISSPGFLKRKKPSEPLATRAPKRKAVLVGVSDAESNEELTPRERDVSTLRAHADVQAIRQFLIDRCGYRSEDICVMIDSDDDNIPDNCRPTKFNVLKNLDRMLRNPSAGDRYFFYFAGHGLQEECLSGTESDGYDELIECVDGQLIKDNELHDHLVKPLVPGCQLVALIDSCHAGTMLDLPHHTCKKFTKFGLAFIAIFRMRKCVVTTSQVANVSPPPSRPFSPFQRPSSSFRSRHCPARALSIPLSSSPVTTHTQSPSSLIKPSLVKSNLSRTRTVDDVTSSTPTLFTTRARSASIPIWIEIASASVKSSTPMMSSSQASPSDAVPLSVRGRGSSITSITQGLVEGKYDRVCDPHQDATLPRVISLGACADKELSYEKDGGLMTSWFLEIMRASKEITYQELMIRLQQKCLLDYQQRLKEIGEYEEAFAKLIKPGEPRLDLSHMKGRQSPQLGSLHPLNMNETIII